AGERREPAAQALPDRWLDVAGAGQLEERQGRYLEDEHPPPRGPVRERIAVADHSDVVRDRALVRPGVRAAAEVGRVRELAQRRRLRARRLQGRREVDRRAGAAERPGKIGRRGIEDNEAVHLGDVWMLARAVAVRQA